MGNETFVNQLVILTIAFASGLLELGRKWGIERIEAACVDPGTYP